MPAATQKQVVMTIRSARGLKVAVFADIGSAMAATFKVWPNATPAMYNKGRLFELDGTTVQLTDVVGDEIVEV